MKTKLLCWEAVMILTTLGLFLIIFSIQNGWELVGTERYNAAAIAVAAAAVTAAVAGVATAFNSILATTASAVAVAAVSIILAIAAGIVVAVTAAVAAVSIILIAVVAAAGIANSNKELKNSFAIISLIIEALVIFGVISAITFLF